MTVATRTTGALTLRGDANGNSLSPMISTEVVVGRLAFWSQQQLGFTGADGLSIGFGVSFAGVVLGGQQQQFSRLAG